MVPIDSLACLAVLFNYPATIRWTTKEKLNVQTENRKRI